MDDLDNKSNRLSNAQNDTSQSSCQSEEASEQVSEENKAVMTMKENLPKYVIDSFIATGFDTLKVISEIDTSNDNDLLEIEQFITDECKEDIRFKPGFGVSGHFKFLPGHKRRIINFINGLKQEAAKSKLKRPNRPTSNECPLVVKTKKKRSTSNECPVVKTKKIKLESNLESAASSDLTACIDPEHQATLAAKIRQQVAKWQRSQKLDKLRELKEIKHFDVNVDVKGERNLSLSITCNICDSRCLLSHKNEHILISNWTRHVSKCVEKIKKPIPNGSIKDFLLPASRKYPDLSKVSSSESSSPLPQSSPDEVRTFFSSSADVPFETTESEQSVTSYTTDDDTASNIAQVSTIKTSCSQLCSDGESVYLTGESIAEPHTDWSRSTRKKLALLQSGSDHYQTKITSFFDLVDKVNSILSKHPEISQIFSSSSVETATETTAEKSIQFSPLFKSLIRNTEKNLEKLPQQVRHNSLLKKFATSLLIYCGPMAYNFICCNMPRALPSLRTVQRNIAAEYRPFQEGTFRFDELLEHLKRFNASKVVSLGEDSTRVVSGVHYDSETNKLVGFVLPCNDNGLPVCDTFLATSFEAMETSFKEGSIAKYAFVYMIQPLTSGVPAFCLACIGTDNKFDAELVIKRWHYIHNELNRRGITLVSIGADGDSRELRAMQVSTQLLSSTQNSLNSLSSINNKITIPSEWKEWFAMKRPANIAYIQDMVHVAVKLKTRFLQPSIILPLGSYLAGVHHLRIIQHTFSKDQHGLREKDINFKDKQNYEAVSRMTSSSVTTLLSKLPDAKGTAVYLDIIKSVTDSFLDKSIEPLDRVQKAWYAVFVLRYWRQWIVLHPDYTIGSNFITCNTYMCIELNAHSLLSYILSLQSLLPPDSDNFIPWLLGSQCCEKVFRAARSMTSTFSTIINFGLLGLLRRFNRLQIQLKLESECDETSIRYPRAEAHKKKDGHCKPGICNLHALTKEKILKTVERARELAKETIEDLGMAEMLQSNGNWDNPPIPGSSIEVSEEDDQDDDDDDACNDNLEDTRQEVNSNVDPDDVSSGIGQLTKAEVIDQGLQERLNSLHKGTFKKVESAGLPIYQLEHDPSSKAAQKPRFCAFVEVEHNNKKVFIHKTTATWLLHEGERVSSDRLFRVRTDQPFSIDTKPKVSASVSVDIPIVCSTVDIGNMCIFKSSESSLKIGRLLQFAYYLENKKGSRQHRGLTAKVDDKKVGVLCTWYAPCASSPRKYSLVQGKINNDYVPITTYLCTLSHGCFENFENINIPPAINASYNVKNAELMVSQHLVLTEAAAMNVMNLLQDSNAADAFETASSSKPASKGTSAQIIVLDDKNTNAHCKSLSADQWVTCGRISLTKKDKQHILLGKELSDLHVNAFHSMARTQFPLVGGLYNTLVLKKMSLTTKDGCDHEHAQSLQIIHIKERSHWAALQLVKSEIYLYDSLFSSASTETLELLAQLVKTRESFLSINIMNIHKQTGTSDCALFSIAAVTCLLFDGDPTTVVFDQKELRLHFIKILETNVISLFPTLKSRRPVERISRVQRCQVYCICRLPDTAGDEMVSCDDCQEWFHISCLNLTESPSTEKWFCNNCFKDI